MSIMTEKELNTAIAKIGTGLAEWRNNVQDALVSCAYHAAKGNANPANALLSAVRDGKTSAVNISGITRWCETYAPLVVREERFIINKGMAKSMAVTDEKSFELFEVKARAVSWWLMGKAQKAESIYDVAVDVSNRMESIAKKANEEGFPEIAAEIRAQLGLLKLTTAWKEAVAVPAAPATAPVSKNASDLAAAEKYNAEVLRRQKAEAKKAAPTTAGEALMAA